MLIIYLLKQRSLARYQHSWKLSQCCVTNIWFWWPTWLKNVLMLIKSIQWFHTYNCCSTTSNSGLLLATNTAGKCPSISWELSSSFTYNTVEASPRSAVSRFTCDLLKLVATIFLCSLLLFLLLCLSLNHSLCSSSHISEPVYVGEESIKTRGVTGGRLNQHTRWDTLFFPNDSSRNNEGKGRDATENSDGKGWREKPQ